MGYLQPLKGAKKLYAKSRNQDGRLTSAAYLNRVLVRYQSPKTLQTLDFRKEEVVLVKRESFQPVVDHEDVRKPLKKEPNK